MIEVDNNITCEELRKKVLEIISGISDVSLLEKILGVAEEVDYDEDDFEWFGTSKYSPQTYEEAMERIIKAENDFQNGQKNFVPLDDVIKESYKRIRKYADCYV
ncbi:MAG: hypothetical protein II956_16465 [Bacteroidales bacterium]|nr:hypothetical protein [Bacteroidales bacterium]